MAEEELKVYGVWLSPHSYRIQLALKLKGVPYEYFEEDISNKSPSLLKYNPVFKQVPVLVHSGKPILESLIILEYIDETWKNNPILPQDPYERAMARFWAKFIDEKVMVTLKKASFCEDRESKEQIMEEVAEQMKVLENELNGKDFFGGEKIGFLDIVASLIAFWFFVQLEITGTDTFTQENFPGLFKWKTKLEEIDVVNECRPDREKHLAFIRNNIQSPK